MNRFVNRNPGTIILVILAFNLYGQNDCGRYGDNSVGTLVRISKPLPCAEGSLMLVFEDHFDGKELDHTRWYERTRVVRDYDFVHSKQFYKKENVVVEDGKMKLVAKREHLSGMTFGDNAEFKSNFDFTSGEVNTLFEFGYGVYEIRCKLPQGATKGFFPAFWGFSDASNIWHEIDIFEAWSSHNIEHGYALKEVTFTSFREIEETDGKKLYRCSNDFQNDTDLGAGFHTYKVVYQPDYIEWYVDGTVRRKTWRYYTLLGQGVDCGHTNTNTTYVHNRSMPYLPMNIKIDLAIENGVFRHKGNTIKRRPDANTKLPNTFEVDYVKIWQNVPCNGDVFINSQAELDELLSEQNNFYNVIYGENIFLDNSILKSKKSLVLVSPGKIDVGPDFHTENGSFFEMQSLPRSPCLGTSMPNVHSSGFNRNLGGVSSQIGEVLEDHGNSQSQVAINPVSSSDGGYSILEMGTDQNKRYLIQVHNMLGQKIHEEEAYLSTPKHLSSQIFSTTGLYTIRITSRGSHHVTAQKIWVNK